MAPMAFHESSRSFVHLGPGSLAQTELAAADGSLRGHVRPLWETLARFSPADLRNRQSKIQSLSSELGIHFTRDGSRSLDETSWQLDILPRVIDPAEWAALEAGLIQRGRAFSQLIADLFGPQRILQDRVLPPELIFDDPTYLWECLNLPTPRHGPLLTGAVDLVRDRTGRWFATQNHFSSPVGASFVLQYRRMLTQAFPEIFESTNIRPVSSFGADLAEALTGLSPRPNPHIVMLARSDSDDAWFEESFLARRMGVAMVQPADLLVRGDRVFLKTVAGLEQVDVIYRRLASASLDPIAFGARGARGVPGLLNCIRAGTVVVANAPGTGVADNKALLPHSDAIIRYYLHEEPLLPTATTYHCADPDLRDYVREHLDDLLLKPIHRRQEVGEAYRDQEDQDYLAAMRRLLEDQPGLVVAQPFVDASALPRFENGRFIIRPAYFRAFLLLGENPAVLAGGLTRQALENQAQARIADLAGGAKDTWIPAAATPSPSRRGPRRPAPRTAPRTAPREFRIGSRVGESLYWLGRYCERAEHTARMVRVMEEAGWSQLSRRERQNIWPLWQAVAASTGQEALARIQTPPASVADITSRLVIDNADPASVLSCIRFARSNAGEIREFITPEVWAVLQRFSAVLDRGGAGSAPRGGQILDICQYCVDELACLHGTITRTMPHDDGFQFYRAGMMLERGICTLTVLDIALVSALVHSDPATPLDPDLTLLLRLLGSLDAYQREYRSRAYLGLVAELLLKNEETPSSAAFCCTHLAHALREILHGMRAPHYRRPLVQAESLRQNLRGLNTLVLFPAPALDADRVDSRTGAELERMRRRLEKTSHALGAAFTGLHELIEDTFFSHQNGKKTGAKTAAGNPKSQTPHPKS